MQKPTIQGLEELCTTYRTPIDIDSDQGTHFTHHKVQEWASKNDICWHFHLPYNPTAAGLIERMKGLLKQQLRQEIYNRTFQEQSSQGLRHVNPETTSQHHPSSTVDHQRTTANYRSGQ